MLIVTTRLEIDAHYWIIGLGENYEYAVVGHPARKYLWILSREDQMEEDLFQEIAERLRIQGYDPAGE